MRKGGKMTCTHKAKYYTKNNNADSNEIKISVQISECVYKYKANKVTRNKGDERGCCYLI